MERQGLTPRDQEAFFDLLLALAAGVILAIPVLLLAAAGDMSFVGPRPALFDQHDLIDLRTPSCVHEFVPGLTG